MIVDYFVNIQPGVELQCHVDKCQPHQQLVSIWEVEILQIIAELQSII